MDTQSAESIRFYLSERLDLQRTEHWRLLFGSNVRAQVVDTTKDADVIVIDIRELVVEFADDKPIRPKLLPNKVYMVLALNDLGFYNDFGGLMNYDNGFRAMLRKQNTKLVYVQCENEPWRESGVRNILYRGDDNIVRISLPLGYISGSKVNISYEDNDDSALFHKGLQPNPKRYHYDWGWMGTESVRQRTLYVQQLYENADKDTLWTNVLKNYGRLFPAAPRYKFPGPYSQHKNILVVSKPITLLEKEVKDEDGKWSKAAWEKKINADRRMVPHKKYLRLLKQTKVNISFNGWGMWCYKDAELLAHNCFCLRENHKNINVNPLSPKDGKHWVLFEDFKDLTEKIQYYLNNDSERERINDNGNRYFIEGITGLWASIYMDGLCKYLKTGKSKAFGRLCWKGKTDGSK